MGKNLDIIMLFDFYRNLLTDKQAEVIDLYYNEDLSLAEISEILSVTRQGVRDNIKRAEGIMIDAEEKLGVVAKFNYQKSVIKEAQEIVADILNSDLSEDVSKSVSKLSSLLSGIED